MSNIVLIRNNKKLTKLQEKFNTLVKNIDKNKQTVSFLEKALHKFTGLRSSALKNRYATLEEIKFKYVTLLDSYYEKQKFSKKDKEKIAQMIVNIASGYDNSLVASTTNELHEKYSNIQLKQFSTSANEEDTEMLSDFLKSTFGVKFKMGKGGGNVNFDEIKAGIENYLNNLKQKQVDEENFFRKNKHTRSNSAAKNKTLAANVNKTWKKIYMELVKKLHPDTELDEQKKIEKTDILKEVTNAYEGNDFYKLIQLQVQYADEALTNQDLEDDIMKEYIKILTQQNTTLKEVAEELRHQAYLMGFFLPPNSSDATCEKAMETAIANEKREVTNDIKSMKAELEKFLDIEVFKRELKTLSMADLNDDVFGNAFLF